MHSSDAAKSRELPFENTLGEQLLGEGGLKFLCVDDAPARSIDTIDEADSVEAQDKPADAAAPPSVAAPATAAPAAAAAVALAAPHYASTAAAQAAQAAQAAATVLLGGGAPGAAAPAAPATAKPVPAGFARAQKLVAAGLAEPTGKEHSCKATLLVSMRELRSTRRLALLRQWAQLPADAGSAATDADASTASPATAVPTSDAPTARAVAQQQGEEGGAEHGGAEGAAERGADDEEEGRSSAAAALALLGLLQHFDALTPPPPPATRPSSPTDGPAAAAALAAAPAAAGPFAPEGAAATEHPQRAALLDETLFLHATQPAMLHAIMQQRGAASLAPPLLGALLGARRERSTAEQEDALLGTLHGWAEAHTAEELTRLVPSLQLEALPLDALRRHAHPDSGLFRAATHDAELRKARRAGGSKPPWPRTWAPPRQPASAGTNGGPRLRAVAFDTVRHCAPRSSPPSCRPPRTTSHRTAWPAPSRST